MTNMKKETSNEEALLFSMILAGFLLCVFVHIALEYTQVAKTVNDWLNVTNIAYSGVITLILALIAIVGLYLAKTSSRTSKEDKDEIFSKSTKDKDEIVGEIQRLAELLQLSSKIASSNENPHPPKEAKELAHKITNPDGQYALALKAVAEEDYENASLLLNRITEDKDKELEDFNKSPGSYVDIYKLRGSIEYYQGSYGKAVEWYKKALELDTDNVDLLQSISGNLIYAGMLNEETGFYCNRSIYESEKKYGSEHKQFAGSLNNLAGLYRNQGRFDEAESLFIRAILIWEKVQGLNHPDVATGLNNLAGLFLYQGRYIEAKPLFERSLKICKKEFGFYHSHVAGSLNNLAVLHYKLGRYKKAESLYKLSLKIVEKIYGKEHPDTANNLNNLAELYRKQRKYKKAEPLYHKSLKIIEKALGHSHPKAASCLNNIALLYSEQGLYEKAEPLFKESLSIGVNVLGEDHPDIAISLNNLAQLYVDQCRYEEAEPLTRQCLEILEKTIPSHPNFYNGINNYIAILEKLGREEEAKEWAEKGREVKKRIEANNG